MRLGIQRGGHIMHGDNKQQRPTVCVSIIIGFSLVLGCSASPKADVMHSSLQMDQQSARHGQFTGVAIHDSLRDATIFQTAKRIQQPLTHVTPLALVAPPLPLNAQLPETPVHVPEPGESLNQDHDERWHTELGWSLLVGGNSQGAIASYRQAIRQNPTFVEAYVGLGSALRMQNKVTEAIEAYEQALELQPDNPSALVHLGSLYADGEPAHRNIEKAKRLYARASKQGDPFAKIALTGLKTHQ